MENNALHYYFSWAELNNKLNKSSIFGKCKGPFTPNERWPRRRKFNILTSEKKHKCDV